jgi:hypothetical protein
MPVVLMKPNGAKSTKQHNSIRLLGLVLMEREYNQPKSNKRHNGIESLNF